MGFFEKLKRAIIKIKGKLIVAAILVLVILIWAVAPFTVSIKEAWEPARNAEGFVIQDENGQIVEEFNWEQFLLSMGKYITEPWNAVKLCFSNYFSAYFYVCRWFLAFYGVFVFVGVVKAFPKHEYEDIENGSSDWSENGEQYKVLSKSKGIILAEKNYLPTDKRGNVNVLVVRRFWCW